ncbi:MAG: hypothetical protein A2V75_09095 [Actinobacteria bacterium RBG_16_70_17]|nr:MAG: hypothetical protein A2V75_09095 [Actinobacteria bacterium RBG_16_70_17]
MAAWRLTCDLIFATADVPRALRDRIAQVLAQAISINVGQDTQEDSSLTLQRCRHDEEPPGPCDTLYTWTSAP